VRKAAIDLGTNTCLLLVCEQGKDLEVLTDQSEVVRLGEGIFEGKGLVPEAMERTVSCLKKYRDIVLSYDLDPSEVICVGTAQSRAAHNAVLFFDRIEKETGFKFITLSGEEEASTSFLGALLPFYDPSDCIVIDIGGGSTEFQSKSDGKSLDLGSVRITEGFLKEDPVADQEFWSAQDEIDRQLSALSLLKKKWIHKKTWIAVAGTAVTLAQWWLGLSEFDPSKIENLVLRPSDLHRMVNELKWRTIEERKELVGIHPKRADVLLAGAIILWRSMVYFEVEKLHVSTRGLRYGLVQRTS
tara:strand:- start:1912 stop:2811 length:900 start_codon:yes stop_codon:yes gene_type:complete